MARLTTAGTAVASTLLACTAIAAALAALVPAVGGFRIAWVNSVCIGMLAMTLIYGGRHVLWQNRAPPAWGVLVLATAGSLVAVTAGGLLAGALLGKPADWLVAGEDGVRAAALVATVGGTALFTAVVWVRQYTAGLRLRAELEQARADAAARLADEARLRMLRAQLEPHMLFNTLATLRALIGVDPPRAQAMLDSLVSFLRGTLAGSRADRVPLEAEFALLDDYLALMALRMGERLAYRLALPEALRARPIPPMLVQPLVENAVRHGLEPAPAGGSVSVTAQAAADGLCISVIDTGVGLDAAGLAPADTPTGGFGLDAVRARLRAAFGEAARLEVDSPWPPGACQGTRARLILPP